MLFIFAAAAQVTPIGPFGGAYTENFDTTPQTGAAVDCVADAFDGVATVCASEATVGGMQVRPSLFLGCELEARSAPHLAGSNDGPTEIAGGAAFSRIGGYFGTHATNAGDLRIELYAADGSLLLQDDTTFGGSCQWVWKGYEAVGTPIARMVVIRTSGDGALADLDDLRLDLACGPSDLDCDGAPSGVDCDDRDALRAPGAAEACDGIDNDCDGAVPADEVDADADGVRACLDCDDGDPSVLPGAVDDCDGVDDDCDGSDGNAPPSVPPGSLQEGVCAGSVQACVSGSWTDPDYASLPGFEADEATCDGADNDCDGATDEALQAPPVSTGLGVCALLVATCEGAQGWVEPPDFAALVDWEAEETACDGQDNDCDGEVDEGEGPPASLQDGVCAGSAQVCVDGDWLDPVWEEIEGFDPVEICDGLDNDCDGLVDDDCVEPDGAGLPCGCASDGRGAVWLALAAAAVLRRRRI